MFPKVVISVLLYPFVKLLLTHKYAKVLSCFMKLHQINAPLKNMSFNPITKLLACKRFTNRIRCSEKTLRGFMRQNYGTRTNTGRSSFQFKSKNIKIGRIDI